MSRDHEGCSRGFIWHSQAWYAKSSPLNENVTDELNIGFYHPEGGTSGEFCIQWEELSGKVVARLMAFDDSWSALAKMPELIEYMESVDDLNIPISEFVDKLLNLGFTDNTARTR